MLGPANRKEVRSGAAERSAGKDHRTPEPAKAGYDAKPGRRIRRLLGYNPA